MAKNATNAPTSTTPTTVISHRKMYKASAHGAMVEACCGHIAEEVSHLVRNCQSTGLIPIVCLYSSCPFSRSVLLFSGDSGRGTRLTAVVPCGAKRGRGQVSGRA